MSEKMKPGGQFATRKAYLIAQEVEKALIPVKQLASVSSMFDVLKKIYNTEQKRIYAVRRVGGRGTKTVFKLQKLHENREERAWRIKMLTDEVKYHCYINSVPNDFVAKVRRTVYQLPNAYGMELEMFEFGDFSQIPSNWTIYSRLQVLSDAARGLHYLHHQLGIVHGDLKLHNLIISTTPGGGYMGKLIDFGSCKPIGYMVTQGTCWGDTLNFRSPELWPSTRGAQMQQLNVNTDIWALGCVALALATKNQYPPWVEAQAKDVCYSTFLRNNPGLSNPNDSGKNPKQLRFHLGGYNNLNAFSNKVVFNLLRIQPNLRWSTLQIVTEITSWLKTIAPGKRRQLEESTTY